MSTAEATATFDEATKELQMEANETIDIFYSAEGFGDSTRNLIQASLIEYARSVHEKELSKLSSGDESLYSTGELRKLITIFNRMDTKTITNR